MFKIKDITIKNRIVVGPMAGISNSAFREIVQAFGAGLVYTEMISDKAIYYNNKKTLSMTKLTPDEGIVSMQLFGHEIDSMVFAAKYLDEKTDCAIIDINMGCPVAKVVNSGGGAALMKNSKLAFEIVKQVGQAVKKPVTVKMRVGWDKDSINAVEFAQSMQEAGAAAIAVHGRVRSQYYEGKADWQLIKEVKDNTDIPIIGNGDINCVADVIEKLNLSGCDAVMLARGVLGNPWLIKEAVQALANNNETLYISIEEKFTMAKDHAKRLIALKGEAVAMKQMRSHGCWYIYGLPYNHQIKDLINQMTSYQQFDTILKDYQALLIEIGE